MKYSYSKTTIGLIVLSWFIVFFYFKNWNRNPISNDVKDYYGYLPALYIQHDLSLNFINKDPAFFGDKYWPVTAPNGGKVIKMTMGLSMVYTPFFLIGHCSAWLSGYPADGFSKPYIISLLIGCIVVLSTGFIFLRKLLLKYFSEKITSLVLLSLYFGTNLFWYTWGEALFSHAYSFSLLCIFLYLTERWHLKITAGNSVLLGFLAGLISLIRPSLIIVVFFLPMLYSIHNTASLREKWEWIKTNLIYIVYAGIAFFLVQVPQLIYWKINTGSWFYYSYTNEGFYFNNPHLQEGLFGYRKGWLLYTPIMIFALAGFFCTKTFPALWKLALGIPFVISVYVILSWWTWWYGGSFGHRAFIDYYSLLAVPMAAFYKLIYDHRYMVVKGLFSLLLSFLIVFNLFQNWQYHEGLIHFEGMSKKSYWIGLFQKKYSAGWWESIEYPNYYQAIKGKPEYLPGKNKDEIIEILKENDFNNLRKSRDSIFLTSSFSPTGNFNFRLGNEKEYSPEIVISGRELVDKRAVKFEAKIRLYSLKYIEEGAFYFVISFENDSASYKYFATDINTFSIEPDQWNEIKTETTMEEFASPNDRVKTYIWKRKGGELFLDDFSVCITRKKI